MQCNILKNQINDLHNTFDNLIYEKDNLNVLIGNQRESYNKADLGYESKIMSKNLAIFVVIIRSSNAILLNVIPAIKMGMSHYFSLLKEILKVRLIILILISI